MRHRATILPRLVTVSGAPRRLVSIFVDSQLSPISIPLVHVVPGRHPAEPRRARPRTRYRPTRAAYAAGRTQSHSRRVGDVTALTMCGTKGFRPFPEGSTGSRRPPGVEAFYRPCGTRLLHPRELGPSRKWRPPLPMAGFETAALGQPRRPYRSRFYRTASQGPGRLRDEFDTSGFAGSTPRGRRAWRTAPPLLDGAPTPCPPATCAGSLLPGVG